ncbi:glycosyltransferase family 2 protein [Phormidesmis priestleyi ULC007]|uniref:Glycosyltransferase family 2 protein n=1 Tax=Phormidesmis priestleyi ULC007 TaxID=1920490 RepID=A0A2T1D2X8_9CYAN|nr:glycosyltransferase family A protein [Phormidesmis priestleyi]PSB14754.1 glycosyltransferase family 2 protein [Phormidesmis priestleyi ULC007]
MKLSLITATYFRSELLRDRALPSVLNHSDCEFEWIVVNDGRDAQTRELIQSLQLNCSLVYLELEHPSAGFGLCHARNLGLSVATGEWVAYLDDDNAIAPTFVAETTAFFQQYPQMQFSMVQQSRRRDIVRNGEIIKQGQPFISPSAGCTPRDLVQQRELFDSNGFTHRRENAPHWNPGYRVFVDYEYFLQCLVQWGSDGFSVHSDVLVDYVQSSDGVIGRSSYGEWADELCRLLQGGCDALTEADVNVLKQLVQKWHDREAQNQRISAFN